MLVDFIFNVIIALSFLAISIIIIQYIAWYLDRYLRHLPPIVIFLKHCGIGVGYFFILLITLSIVPQFQGAAYSLLASSSVIAVIAGFAAQHVFANVISGVLLVLTKPFSIGDYIKIGNHAQGIVEDITLRHTELRSHEGNIVLIPNHYINTQIIEKVENR